MADNDNNNDKVTWVWDVKPTLDDVLAHLDVNQMFVDVMGQDIFNATIQGIVAGMLADTAKQFDAYQKDLIAFETVQAQRDQEIAQLQSQIATLQQAKRDLDQAKGRFTTPGFAQYVAQNIHFPGVTPKQPVAPVPTITTTTTRSKATLDTLLVADPVATTKEGKPRHYAITIDSTTYYIPGPYYLYQFSPLRDVLGLKQVPANKTEAEQLLGNVKLAWGSSFTVNGHQVTLGDGKCTHGSVCVCQK